MLDIYLKLCFNITMNPNLIIDRLGGTGELAKLCRVSAQAVSQWRWKGIPPARLMFLELLRPDVFYDRRTDDMESME